MISFQSLFRESCNWPQNIIQLRSSRWLQIIIGSPPIPPPPGPVCRASRLDPRYLFAQFAKKKRPPLGWLFDVCNGIDIFMAIVLYVYFTLRANHSIFIFVDVNCWLVMRCVVCYVDDLLLLLFSSAVLISG